MAEKQPQVDSSINTIRQELQVLLSAGVLRPEQFASISAQLPASGGFTSNYTDARYLAGTGASAPPSGGGGPPPAAFAVSASLPQTIAQQAQDPSNPAHPKHHKHLEWAEGVASKFGNAAIWGGGATLGSDVVNSVFNAVK